ncbi:MAG TPA: aspartate 1-decarboxylase [Armatimonadetes bacterium]|nr:aspartate 1-decarboxylase [Armatimonadota bacterium]
MAAYRWMMRAKIHRARVTGVELEYGGSITLDEDLLKASGILPNERVQVLNLSNGARLETYVIKAPAGSGAVILNGPAARLAYPGDEVIIISYALVPEGEAERLRPRVVIVDERNRVKEVREEG